MGGIAYDVLTALAALSVAAYAIIQDRVNSVNERYAVIIEQIRSHGTQVATVDVAIPPYDPPAFIATIGFGTRLGLPRGLQIRWPPTATVFARDMTIKHVGDGIYDAMSPNVLAGIVQVQLENASRPDGGAGTTQERTMLNEQLELAVAGRQALYCLREARRWLKLRRISVMFLAVASAGAIIVAFLPT